jgi:hypothetical protein
LSDEHLGDSRTARAVAAVLVGPHELGHAVPAWLAGLEPTITLLPEARGAIPLGQFDAAIGPSTPTSVIRLCALAPLPLNLGVAAALGTALPATSPVTIVSFPIVAYWAALSAGDVAVAANPQAAREAGRFRTPRRWWQTLVAIALTPVIVVIVAVLLFELPR